MITNFETITNELTDDEKSLLPLVIKGFKTHKKDNPIKAPAIIKALNSYCVLNNIDLKLTDVRLRKLVNYIRANSFIPLIATSIGYYVSYDKEEIQKQIQSMEKRAKSIKDAANGLYFFVESETKGMQP